MDNLRATKPEKARRYEAYLKSRGDMTLALYAHSDMKTEDVARRLANRLSERGIEESPSEPHVLTAARYFIGFMNSVRNRVDATTFAEKRENFILKYLEEYVRSRQQTDGKQPEAFDDFLRRRVDEDKGQDAMIGIMHSYASAEFDRKLARNPEGGKTEEFYRDEFRRLYREGVLRTVGERVLTPLLQRPTGNITRTEDILYSTEARLFLTMEEIEKALEDWGEEVAIFFSGNKNKMKPIQIKGEIFYDTSPQVIASDLESDNEEARSIIHASQDFVGKNLSTKEIERRLNLKVNFYEENAKSAKPEVARNMMDYIIGERFALHMFFLARKLGVEI